MQIANSSMNSPIKALMRVRDKSYESVEESLELAKTASSLTSLTNASEASSLKSRIVHDSSTIRDQYKEIPALLGVLSQLYPSTVPILSAIRSNVTCTHNILDMVDASVAEYDSQNDEASDEYSHSACSIS